ncbi:triose-phosphate isomerase [soil metagenome]
MGNATHGTEILLGAQNCSAHAPGAYTGQVLIESLKQLSCSYCIIGHAEVQQLCPENAQVLAAKAIRLIENGICPILCIGESAQDYELSRGSKKLDELLIPFFEILHNADLQQKKLCIAYEPLWAINSNSTPTPDYIAKQLEHIKTLHLHSIPELVCLKLYGGGVDETNTREFKNIDALDGFLIGRASTDFQKLQKIVEL